MSKFLKSPPLLLWFCIVVPSFPWRALLTCAVVIQLCLDHWQSRSQSPRYPRPAVGNEGLWDKAFTGKQESCDRSNCAGVRHSHIRFYQMQSLFYEAIEFSMEKLGIKVLMKEQYDALLKSYMCRKKVCWWHCRQVSENRLSDFTLDVRLHSGGLHSKLLYCGARFCCYR